MVENHTNQPQIQRQVPDFNIVSSWCLFAKRANTMSDGGEMEICMMKVKKWIIKTDETTQKKRSGLIWGKTKREVGVNQSKLFLFENLYIYSESALNVDHGDLKNGIKYYLIQVLIVKNVRNNRKKKSNKRVLLTVSGQKP